MNELPLTQDKCKNCGMFEYYHIKDYFFPFGMIVRCHNGMQFEKQQICEKCLCDNTTACNACPCHWDQETINKLVKIVGMVYDEAEKEAS